MNVKKRSLWLSMLCVFAITGFISYSYLSPKQINHDFDSIIYTNDGTYEKTTSITIEGSLNRNLVKRDRLSGWVTVDHDLTYEFTAEYDGQKYFSGLYKVDEYARLRGIGTIMISKNMDRVWVMLDDLNERYEIDGYAFGPAKSMEEANEKIKEMTGAQ